MPIVQALERARATQERIRLYYGDVNTGRSWDEEHDVFGRISRSMGTVKAPLLVHNILSIGGAGILTDSIVRIINSRTHRILYTHPNFHTGIFTICNNPSTDLGMTEWPWCVNRDDSLVARFKTQKRAVRYVKEMRAYQ